MKRPFRHAFLLLAFAPLLAARAEEPVADVTASNACDRLCLDLLADADAARTAWPAGLWVADVALDTVDFEGAENPAPAGGPLTLTRVSPLADIVLE